MDVNVIKNYIVHYLLDNYGVEINGDYDTPLLKERKRIKARDLVFLLCNACDHFGVSISQILEYNLPITVAGMAQYIADCYAYQNQAEVDCEN